jgi:phage-related tail fiber protein
LGISDSVKSGTVIYFAANAAPSGYLAANGAAVSRTTYAALFAAIGTAFGAGDGATTFNLPDGRGEFIRGWDNGRGIDSGRVFGSAQAQDVQPHTHSIGTDVRGAGIGGLVCLANNGGAYLTGSTGTSETRPRNIALLACIKY